MQAAVVASFANPPQYARFEDPVAGEGETLVHVTAAALHQIVKSLANGTHYGSTGEFPFVPGVDGTGYTSDGTRVYFGTTRSPYGTMAEMTVASPKMLIPLPDGLDDAVAAGMANPAMSSWVALSARARFVAGESVLVLGANGTSGRLALQIAKRRGARHVTAVARKPDEALLRSLGADSVIALDDQAVENLRSLLKETGVDIVLDYLWGAPAEQVLQAIAQKGLSHSAPRVRYIQIGNMAGVNVTLPAPTLRSSGLEILGSGFGSASMSEIQSAIADFFAEAARTPFVSEIKQVPLADVASQWNADETARIVFRP